MTNKTSKMMLFSSVIFTLMLLSISIDSAYAEKPADKTDYVSLWGILDAEIRENDKKIESIELQLMKNDTSDIDKETQNTLMDLKSSNQNYWKQIDELEQLNMESYVLDPETERKFIDAEQKLRNKYLNSESKTYVGENGVEGIASDYKMREIFVLIDVSDLMENGFTTTQIQSIVSDIKSTVDVDVVVEFGKITDVSCTNRTSVCNPGKSGIQIQRLGVGSGSTLSYKATHGTHGDGFVIAGHEANAVGKLIVQPTSGSLFGTVKVMGVDLCDCAFVKLAAGKSVNDEIWAPEVSSTYPIDTRVANSAHTAGKFLNLSAVGSGVKLGDIQSLSASGKTGIVKISVTGGDSGGTLYKPLVNGNADLYGHAYAAFGATKALYEGWEHTKSQLSLTD